jgi:acyl-CoA oxidase
MAYNSTDNGYAKFDHVRIPRSALLARYNTVDKDGTYKAHHLRGKLLYSGLSGGRLLIIRKSAFQLAQALTIATRYSVVRQQGESRDPTENPETQIIHYKLQHYRLLTLISRAYANVFASKSVHAVHKEMQAEQASGNHRLLSTFHVLSSGLKAWATQTAVDGAEDARKMCGGHGYLMISGLPDIVLSVTATCTFEGENVVMWKQVSSYLMKSMAADSLPEDMAYMNGFQDPESTGSYGDSDFLRPEILLEIFEHRAARLTNEVYVQLQQAKGSRAQAENRFAVELHIAARAHIDVFILRSFIEHISAITLGPIKAALTRLLLLHALTTISSPLPLSSATFHFSYTQIGVMRQHTNDLLEQLLPDAVALTDAFNFTDASLASALGCRDGNVYERLMSWTRQLPINVQAQTNGGVWKQGWEEGVKPFLKDGEARQARGVKRGRL